MVWTDSSFVQNLFVAGEDEAIDFITNLSRKAAKSARACVHQDLSLRLLEETLLVGLQVSIKGSFLRHRRRIHF